MNGTQSYSSKLGLSAFSSMAIENLGRWTSILCSGPFDAICFEASHFGSINRGDGVFVWLNGTNAGIVSYQQIFYFLHSIGHSFPRASQRCSQFLMLCTSLLLSIPAWSAVALLKRFWKMRRWKDDHSNSPGAANPNFPW